MNQRLESHLFWGAHSPLAALAGLGIIIMASSMLATALICSAALIWVYGLTTLIFYASRKIMPSRGTVAVLVFLSAFVCGVFMLLLSLLSPLLVMGTGFLLILVPSYCLGQGFFGPESLDPVDAVSRAILEALTLSGVIIAIALIREPLGMGTLSLPGGSGGIVELFASQEEQGPMPLRFLSVSSGALLLLGYGTALYRYFREQYAGTSRKRETEEEQ